MNPAILGALAVIVGAAALANKPAETPGAGEAPIEVATGAGIATVSHDGAGVVVTDDTGANDPTKPPSVKSSGAELVGVGVLAAGASPAVAPQGGKPAPGCGGGCGGGKSAGGCTGCKGAASSPGASPIASTVKASAAGGGIAPKPAPPTTAQKKALLTAMGGVVAGRVSTIDASRRLTTLGPAAGALW